MYRIVVLSYRYIFGGIPWEHNKVSCLGSAVVRLDIRARVVQLVTVHVVIAIRKVINVRGSISMDIPLNIADKGRLKVVVVHFPLLLHVTVPVSLLTSLITDLARAVDKLSVTHLVIESSISRLRHL